MKKRLFDIRFWNKVYKRMENYEGTLFYQALNNEKLVPMEWTGLYDSTKFKELPESIKEKWLKTNKAENWPGIKIYVDDVTQIKYGKDHYEYGVVHYSECAAGYYRGGTSLGSYKKQTKVVGNIYEGYPKEAEYSVKFHLDNK